MATIESFKQSFDGEVVTKDSVRPFSHPTRRTFPLTPDFVSTSLRCRPSTSRPSTATLSIRRSRPGSSATRPTRTTSAERSSLGRRRALESSFVGEVSHTPSSAPPRLPSSQELTETDVGTMLETNRSLGRRSKFNRRRARDRPLEALWRGRGRPPP